MRTRTALLLGLLGGITTLLGPSAQALTPPAPEPWANASPNLTLVSQGFGHGIGLSQWGAEYRAEAHQTLQQILDFYYPGTTAGVANGLVRVLITGDSDHNTVVRPAAGLKVTDLGTGTSYLLPTKGKATAWRLSFVSGKNRLAWLSKGVWHGYRPGGKLLTGAGQFSAKSNLLTLHYAGTDHRYRGAMRFVGGRTINVVGLDNYLKGVVPSEAYTTWLPAALQAQAVAARTYAAFERAEFANRSYQICDSNQCQVYGGYDAEVASTTAAVVATAGRAVFYGGQLAFTQFSSSNGVYTADGGKPYLKIQKDTYDTAYRNRSLAIGPMTTAKIQNAYPQLGTFQKIRVLGRGADNRVTKVQLAGSGNGDVEITGNVFRTLVGARSSNFAFTNSP